MKKVVFAIFAFSLALQGSNALAKCSDYATCAEAVKAWKAGDGKLDRDKDGIPCEKLCGKNGENMPKQ
jgi:uncharacterized protein (DUF2141 family)